MKSPTTDARVVAADRAFFANLFASIADEMGVVLRRTAYSPNIKERRDFSCALFDAQANMVAQAAHIPVHLGAMPMSVQAVLSRFPTLHPGDVAILNDPYAGGTHLPDITLVSPCFAGRSRKPLAYLASRAHHADVGGATPGSLPLARELFQEGLRIPPLLLCRKRVVDEGLLELLLANVRTPEERRGDLRAQLAAHSVGESRLQEAVQEHRSQRLCAAMDDLLDYGERLMRNLIEKIPDGTYRHTDRLDDDGLGNGPLPIAVTLAIRGHEATIDFTGTAPACEGSLNAVEAITRSAVVYAFLCLLATPSKLHDEPLLDPPLNSGCFRPLRLVLPPDSLVNAAPGHAVSGGNVETSQRIVDVVFGALAQALPGIVPAASQGTMNNLTLGGLQPDGAQRFAYYETMAGGMGAHARGDGASALHAHMTNTLNTPVEALEFAYPLRVERYEIVSGTGGNGQHCGGNGLRRDLRALVPMQGVLLTERRVSTPPGLDGGHDGAPGQNHLVRDGRARRLPAKCELNLAAGDVIRVQTPGGGGYGAPAIKTNKEKTLEKEG